MTDTTGKTLTGKTLSILRRYARRPVIMSARLRMPGGPAEPVKIIDIGEEGCCIECWGMPYNPGDKVLICPDGLEQLVGEVRWTKGHRLGIQFGKQLYSPVVDHISRKHHPYESTLSAGQHAVLRMVA